MSWTKIKLEKIISSKNDKSKQVNASEYLSNGSFPIIDQSDNFIAGYYEDETKVVKNNLPLTVFGDHTRHVKFINFPFVCGADGTQLMIPIGDIDNKYFYFLIYNASILIGNFGYDRHFKHLKEFLTPFTEEKPEQTKIACILSKADEAIAQTEALIAKYQRIKTGLMEDLLTKGIDELGNIRSEKTHRFKTEIGLRVPEEWSVKYFNQLLVENIIDSIQDGNHGEKHPKSSDFAKEGIPFIMASDISKDEIDLEHCKKITKQQFQSLRIGFAKPQDVLLSHKASIGFVTFVPESLSEIMLTPQVTYYRIKNKDKLNYKFLCWYMRGDVFQNELSNFAKQSTRDYIGILMQRNLTLAYPNKVHEQKMIYKKIDGVNQYLKSLSNNLSKLQSVKTGLMQDLLSGKVRVKIKEEVSA